MCTAATYVSGSTYACNNTGCSTTLNLPYIMGTAATITLETRYVPQEIHTYPYSWSWHGTTDAIKCPNCGYCGRADVWQEDGPVPGDGSDGGVHGAEGA